LRKKGTLQQRKIVRRKKKRDGDGNYSSRGVHKSSTEKPSSFDSEEERYFPSAARGSE